MAIGHESGAISGSSDPIGLIVLLVLAFHLESLSFGRVMILTFTGFLIHHYLKTRSPAFTANTTASGENSKPSRSEFVVPASSYRSFRTRTDQMFSNYRRREKSGFGRHRSIVGL